jgi:hypothetical protein
VEEADMKRALEISLMGESKSNAAVAQSSQVQVLSEQEQLQIEKSELEAALKLSRSLQSDAVAHDLEWIEQQQIQFEQAELRAAIERSLHGNSSIESCPELDPEFDPDLQKALLM